MHGRRTPMTAKARRSTGASGALKRPEADEEKTVPSTPTGQSSPTPPVAKKAGTSSVRAGERPDDSNDAPTPSATFSRGRGGGGGAASSTSGGGAAAGFASR